MSWAGPARALTGPHDRRFGRLLGVQSSATFGGGRRAGDTALKRLLALTGARVVDVVFGVEGIVVGVALTRRRLVCSRCGQVYRATYDSSCRRWRHLDLAGRETVRLTVCEPRRLDLCQL